MQCSVTLPKRWRITSFNIAQVNTMLQSTINCHLTNYTQFWAISYRSACNVLCSIDTACSATQIECVAQRGVYTVILAWCHMALLCVVSYRLTVIVLHQMEQSNQNEVKWSVVKSFCLASHLSLHHSSLSSAHSWSWRITRVCWQQHK